MTTPSLLRRCLFGASVLMLSLLPRSAAAQAVDWSIPIQAVDGSSARYERLGVVAQPNGVAQVWEDFRYPHRRSHDLAFVEYDCHGQAHTVQLNSYNAANVLITQDLDAGSWHYITPGSVDAYLEHAICRDAFPDQWMVHTVIGREATARMAQLMATMDSLAELDSLTAALSVDLSADLSDAELWERLRDLGWSAADATRQVKQRRHAQKARPQASSSSRNPALNRYIPWNPDPRFDPRVSR